VTQQTAYTRPPLRPRRKPESDQARSEAPTNTNKAPSGVRVGMASVATEMKQVHITA
jgi:hypothetical protein